MMFLYWDDENSENCLRVEISYVFEEAEMVVGEECFKACGKSRQSSCQGFGEQCKGGGFFILNQKYNYMGNRKIIY